MADRIFPRVCNAPGPGPTHCSNPPNCAFTHFDAHADVDWPHDETQDHACQDPHCSTNRPDGITAEPDWSTETPFWEQEPAVLPTFEPEEVAMMSDREIERLQAAGYDV